MADVKLYQVVLEDAPGAFICVTCRDRTKREAVEAVELLNPCLAELKLQGYLHTAIVAVAMPQEG